MMVKTLYVLDVPTDVKPVPHVTLVPNVMPQESMLQNVDAQVVNTILVVLMMVPVVIQIALIHNVDHVTIPVKLVPIVHKDLVYVLLTELMMLMDSVFVMKDTMPLTIKLIAQLVMLPVFLVLVMLDVVLNVLNLEPSDNSITITLVLIPVNVIMDIMKPQKENVPSVTSNVYLVKLSKITVSNVTVTESD